MPDHQGDAIQSSVMHQPLPPAQFVHHSGSLLGNQTRLAKHHCRSSGREISAQELPRLLEKDKPSYSASSRRSFAATHVAALPGCPAVRAAGYSQNSARPAHGGSGSLTLSKGKEPDTCSSLQLSSTPSNTNIFSSYYVGDVMSLGTPRNCTNFSEKEHCINSTFLF